MSEKTPRPETINCPECSAPLVGSPSKCDYCGSGFYYETLDKKTGLERDRRFEEGLVQFVARVAEAAEVRFEWGGVSAEHFTLGFVVYDADSDVSYAELTFEKNRVGRGAYIFDLRPYEGHSSDDIRSGAWLEIIPIQKKNGGAVYRISGGGLLRYTDGSFSGDDLGKLNLDSVIGKIIIGFVGRR